MQCKKDNYICLFLRLFDDYNENGWAASVYGAFYWFIKSFPSVEIKITWS